jgi:phage major head subunit gpT-like protein
MAINRSQIRDLLLPGLADVEGRYPQIPVQYKQLFTVRQSKMAFERSAEMRYTGLAQLKAEGGATTFDNASGERYVYNALNLSIGLGFAITREALDDNLYKDEFSPQTMGLAESFGQTKEIIHANILNTATTFNAQIGGDGVSLANTAHPIDGGTYANTFPVPLTLNESAIESALTIIRAFPDQSGKKTFSRGRKLVVPPNLMWTAERMLKSELRPDTANNDVNPIVSSGALPEGYAANDFLTSNFAWGIVTNIQGLVSYDRVPFELDMQVDPTTGNLLVVGYERYVASYKNPRGLFWSQATA